MEIRFISSLGPIDLTEAKVSVQENNSKVSDAMFTKYTLPFDFYATQEFLRNYGDYVSYETTDLQNKVPGYFQFENRVQVADLFIQSIEGHKITAQIDFGFEELPNFDKKLSELPLEKYDVADIYSFATDVCKKKWPETNFNFPRMYTDKYSPDSEPWNNFDGYINDLKKDGTEMRRNYIDESGNIFNVNILQPCPHPIYLLQKGFEDAGLELSGDILSDANLQQKWIFSGTQYFTTKRQIRKGFNFTSVAFDETFFENGPDDYVRYDKKITIEKSGRYTLAGVIGFWCASKMYADYVLLLNGVIIWRKQMSCGKASYYEDIALNMNFDIPENSEMSLRIYTQYHEDSWTHQMANLLLTSNALEDIASNEEDSNVITNPNQIDLSRAVPEMTFGEFVVILKNWFNYDIDIIDKTVIMNLIGKDDVKNVKDFEFSEVPSPKRNLLNKKSYLLKFADLKEGSKKDSMFYDSTGQLLNGKELSDTNIIEINGYLMGLKLPKPQGYNTAYVASDNSNTLALVEYSGLQNGQNNATYSPGCDFPQLFDSNWVKWLRQRVNGQEFNWKFYANIEKISQFSIKDYVFCFNNIHIIKSMSKDKISDNFYEIDIVTETVV